MIRPAQYLVFCWTISERQAKLAEELEKLRLEEMDEEEYDALSEQEKARVDEKRLTIKKQRIKRLARSTSWAKTNSSLWRLSVHQIFV